MIAAVHRWTHQVVKARVNQYEVAGAHLFDAAYLRHQHTGFGHRETTRLNFQLHGMTEMGGDLVTRGAPQAVIVIGVDRLLSFAVRNGKPAPGEIASRSGQNRQLAHHRSANLLQMAVIHARANVHVNTHQLQVVTLQHVKRGWHVGIPDAVLAVFAAGVRFWL